MFSADSPAPRPEPAAFDFHSGRENDPVVAMPSLRKKRPPQLSRRSLALPVWGIFILLVGGITGAAIYAATNLWYYHVTLPRVAAQFNLIREWNYWKSEEEDAQRRSRSYENVIAYMKRNRRVLYLRDGEASESASGIRWTKEELSQTVRGGDDLAPGKPTVPKEIQLACEQWLARIVDLRGVRLQARQQRLTVEQEVTDKYSSSPAELRAEIDDFVDSAELNHSGEQQRKDMQILKRLIAEDLRRQPRQWPRGLSVPWWKDF